MKRLNLKNLINSKGTDYSLRITSILSGKGGVGKTVLAYNLAERIAFSGKKVLLVDGDLYFGNLHILANVCPSYGISHFLNRSLSLKEAVTKVNGNLDLLASVGEIEIDTADIKQAAEFITVLRNESKRYDKVIIDHGSGICKFSAVTAIGSDSTMIVMVPELTSISDCYGLTKYLSNTDSSINLALLINRVQDAEEAEYIRRKFSALSERFINRIPFFAGYITESDSYRKSVATQQPVSAITDESVVIQPLNKTIKSLTEGFQNIQFETEQDNKLKINNNLNMADIKE